MDLCLCCGEVGLKTNKAVDRRENGKEEVCRQTEENDEKVVVGHD